MDLIYSDFLVGKLDYKSLEGHLSRVLSTIDSQKQIEVSIIQTKKSEPVFFMRVAPAIDNSIELLGELREERISFKSMYNRWNNISKWVMEIDARTLDRSVISFNPQELTAMTLHEIGHVIYSDRVIEKFYRMYIEAKLKFTLADRFKFKFLTCMYLIPLYTACAAHEISTGVNGKIEEKHCDALTRTVGYQYNLISAFDKIIKAYGTSVIIKDEATTDNLVKKDMLWSDVNITQIIDRKQSLKNELVFKAMNTNSGLFKKAYARISDTIGAYVRNKRNGVNEGVIESFLEKNETVDFDKYEVVCEPFKLTTLEHLFRDIDSRSIETIVVESNLLDAFKSNKDISISEYDLDCVEVEIDRIQNHHDRMYVLDLIYNLLEKIDTIESLMDTNIKYNKYRNKIEPWRKRLEEMRSRTMAKRNFDTERYTLFVKQVRGYEG